jgi:hypothetical protein
MGECNMAQSAAGYLDGLPLFPAKRRIEDGERIEIDIVLDGELFELRADASEPIPKGSLFAMRDGWAHCVALVVGEGCDVLPAPRR